MNIKWKYRNFILENEEKDYMDKKLEKLWGCFREEILFNIYILKRENDYKCEIKLQKGNEYIKSEVKGKTVRLAIDNAVDVLKRKTRSVKALQKVAIN